jgi:hypothetical protein
MTSEQNKHWLTKQLEAAQLAPDACFIALFELIDQTSDADMVLGDTSSLLADLTNLAEQCHIDQPASFAQQILLMAQEAQTKQHNDPNSRALQHAQVVAKALLTAQTKNRFRRYTPAYAIAASFFLLAGVSGIMFGHLLSPSAANHHAIPEQQVILLADNSHAMASNPLRITEMRSQREKMREGRCQFPEAIVFSETERGIYLQNVVHGEISANKEVQDVTSRLREYVRCDYTPMLMKNSIS